MTKTYTAKRRVDRKYVQKRAYSAVNGGEHREVLDRLMEGERIENIAKELQREVSAVETIVNKIQSNYDEGGKRESPIAKLRRAESRLSPHRILTNKEKKFLIRCWSLGRREDDIVVIMHVDPKTVKGVLREFGLSEHVPQRLNVFFQEKE